MKAKAVQYTLFGFFLFPLLILAVNFRIDFSINPDELRWALKNSLIQSFSAAAISVILGFYGALGILTVSSKYKKALKFMAVVPAILPTLFTIMIALALVPPVPMGSVAVIFVMSLIYIGFASSLISELIESQLGNMGLVASLYGLSKFSFLQKILMPTMWRPTLYVFFVIFINVFTSFTVPLLVGGGKGTNFEVLIYEKIFIEQNWPLALGLSLLQMSFIALMAAMIQRKPKRTQAIFVASPMTMSRWGMWALCLYILIYFSGYLKLALNFNHIYYFKEIFGESLLLAMGQSVLFFTCSLLLFFVLFVAVVYIKFQQADTQFLNFFLNPSSVLIGFSFYLLLPHNNLTIDFVKLALVFTSVSFVSFFKSVLEEQMHLYEKSMHVARSFGLSFFSYFFKVFLPQIKQRMQYVISLMFIFCISEYGIIKVSGVGVKTLGVEMASYLSSYRIEGAFVLSLVMLVVWFGAIFSLGVLFGNDQKS